MSLILSLVSLITGGASDRYKFENVSYGPAGERNLLDLYLPKDRAGSNGFLF